LNVLLEPLDTIGPQNEPHFESSETTAKRDVPVSVIDYCPCIAMFSSQKLGRDIQCFCEVFTISNPESRTVEIDKAPLYVVSIFKDMQYRNVSHFVEISTERVRVLVDCVQFTLCAILWACERYTSPGSISMEPNIRMRVYCYA
jgi:hypothetical protein